MGSIDSEGNVTYSTKISDGSGALTAAADVGNGVGVYSSKLMLTKDATLYAKWSDEVTVSYKVIEIGRAHV